MHEVAAAVAVSLLPGRLRYVAVSRLRESFRARRLAPTAPLVDWMATAVLPEDGVVPPPDLAGRAERLWSRGRAAGLAAVPFTDVAYPLLVGRLSDAPAVLWVRGETAALSHAAVAVVGSRAASTAGRLAARELAADLAAAGVVVISGLARGVDAAAHEGALATGRTVAVLGCGADVTYPAEHDALAARIAGRGAVISEFPPGSAPRRHHFPLRNRLISGLSLAVVVVEAAERSGALITARTALDQGREVMAMPGATAGGRNRGAHGLIRDGALLVESAADVLAALRVLPRADAGPAIPPVPDDPLLRVLVPGEVTDLDQLASVTGLAGPVLLAGISRLELDGWVERVPGGRIVRVARKW